MTYSNEWLLERLAQNRKLKYLYFWGHRVRPDGVITKSCLSQWYPAGFSYEGHSYATAEHWMMAGKARLFGDAEVLERILRTENPAVAKKLGREVRGFEVDVWKEHMRTIVAQGSCLKFSQNPELLAYLKTTGNEVLVEASPFDPHWGIGMSKDEAERVTPHDWKGTNWLGWCLMEARDELMHQV
ncbi:NADAR family protein [Neolewinella aurantiaca]|uniref:NADAR family protein n=1 Tax=Neolewinella aurantiaca TaxID=2602767 RepID=A0A5C7FSX7_9BACT|nr:NADAR family protein [Neolewinella aurantiaca]TXF88471.1 NADAR family protein [Neolewinella aurantiaca]